MYRMLTPELDESVNSYSLTGTLLTLTTNAAPASARRGSASWKNMFSRLLTLGRWRTLEWRRWTDVESCS